ncbi:hypothetical protein MX652_16465 [Thauera aromatica]|nr:hypothetical protein [Thauera aromatica]MCK2128260.1 hypothetical protein [Thauera aromatica]
MDRALQRDSSGLMLNKPLRPQQNAGLVGAQRAAAEQVVGGDDQRVEQPHG